MLLRKQEDVEGRLFIVEMDLRDYLIQPPHFVDKENETLDCQTS